MLGGLQGVVWRGLTRDLAFVFGYGWFRAQCACKGFGGGGFARDELTAALGALVERQQVGACLW